MIRPAFDSGRGLSTSGPTSANAQNYQSFLLTTRPFFSSVTRTSGGIPGRPGAGPPGAPAEVVRRISPRPGSIPRVEDLPATHRSPLQDRTRQIRPPVMAHSQRYPFDLAHPECSVAFRG